MSKGSTQRPAQISDEKMSINWDRVFAEKFIVYIWPDDTLCMEDELEEHLTFMSDDYIKAAVTEVELSTIDCIYNYCIERGIILK
jgi:hypothetical protein